MVGPGAELGVDRRPRTRRRPPRRCLHHSAGQDAGPGDVGDADQVVATQRVDAGGAVGDDDVGPLRADEARAGSACRRRSPPAPGTSPQRRTPSGWSAGWRRGGRWPRAGMRSHGRSFVRGVGVGWGWVVRGETTRVPEKLSGRVTGSRDRRQGAFLDQRWAPGRLPRPAVGAGRLPRPTVTGSQETHKVSPRPRQVGGPASGAPDTDERPHPMRPPLTGPLRQAVAGDRWPPSSSRAAARPWPATRPPRPSSPRAPRARRRRQRRHHRRGGARRRRRRRDRRHLLRRGRRHRDHPVRLGRRLRQRRGHGRGRHGHHLRRRHLRPQRRPHRPGRRRQRRRRRRTPRARRRDDHLRDHRRDRRRRRRVGRGRARRRQQQRARRRGDVRRHVRGRADRHPLLDGRPDHRRHRVADGHRQQQQRHRRQGRPGHHRRHHRRDLGRRRDHRQGLPRPHRRHRHRRRGRRHLQVRQHRGRRLRLRAHRGRRAHRHLAGRRHQGRAGARSAAARSTWPAPTRRSRAR